MWDFPQAGMWEQGSVQGFIIFSAPQMRDENIYEYLPFDNVKVFLD
jgi:hypothetical protein